MQLFESLDATAVDKLTDLARRALPDPAEGGEIRNRHFGNSLRIPFDGLGRRLVRPYSKHITAAFGKCYEPGKFIEV